MGEPKGFLVVPVGWNPSDKLRSLEVDDADNLKVAFAAAAQGLVGLHGWIGGAWKKAPIPFGISGSVYRFWMNTALAAGNVVVDDTAVPAGEVWVITRIGKRYDGTSPTNFNSAVISGAISATVSEQFAPVSAQWYFDTLNLVLFPGDILRVGIVGATLNDDLYASAAGYRIDIDQ